MSRKVVASFVVCSALSVGSAHATLIWESDPSRGTSQFGLTGQGNCAAPSFIDTANDATFGPVIRYNKPSDTNRCENHGVRLTNGTKYMFSEGQTIHLGWYSRLNTAANNNANFQWKSLGDGHIQNFPVVLKMIDGQMHLMQRQPQGNPTTFLWRRSISANQWNHYVISMYLSSESRGGWIEFAFNGVRQELLTGGTRFACRTWDTGDHNCPKWGVYGGTGTHMTNMTHRVRVGTTYADVAIGGTVTPTPTPTPTATPTVGPTSTPTPTPTAPGAFTEITPAGAAVTASTSDTNVGSNVVDNSLATRWSGNGDGAWVQLDLGSERAVSHVRVAVYQGNARRNRFEIQLSSGGGVWSTVFNGESSGTTTQEETYDFPDQAARFVRYLGHGNVGSTNTAMNSVTEISVFAPNTPTATPTPTSTPTPTATPTPPTGPVELTPGGSAVTASTHDGNLPANTVDSSLSTRWSANGNGHWIQYDLGSTRTVESVSVAWYQGNTRVSTFDVLVSDSAAGPFNTLAAGLQSNGTSLALQPHDVADGTGRYVRLVGHGNTTNAWNSITEVEIWGR